MTHQEAKLEGKGGVPDLHKSEMLDSRLFGEEDSKEVAAAAVEFPPLFPTSPCR